MIKKLMHVFSILLKVKYNYKFFICYLKKAWI